MIEYKYFILYIFLSFIEQYEAFLKFNHDQIQRRFNGDTPASCKYM